MEQRAGAEEWARRFEQAQASGKGATEVAREHGVSEGTVKWWYSRVRDARGKPSAKVVLTKVDRAPKVETAVASKASSGVVIEIGEVRIHVNTANDVALGIALVRALREAQ